MNALLSVVMKVLKKVKSIPKSLRMEVSIIEKWCLLFTGGVVNLISVFLKQQFIWDDFDVEKEKIVQFRFYPKKLGRPLSHGRFRGNSVYVILMELLPDDNTRWMKYCNALNSRIARNFSRTTFFSAYINNKTAKSILHHYYTTSETILTECS